jgi:hypothetical protein
MQTAGAPSKVKTWPEEEHMQITGLAIARTLWFL